MAKLPERDLRDFWNRLKDVYEYFKSRGISDEIAAAILGNAAREGSGFWDDIVTPVKDKYGKIHYYYGGVQHEQESYDWINTNYGGFSKQHLIKYLADGILGMLPETKSERGSLLNKRFIKFMEKAKTTKSPSLLAYYWETIYEISGKALLDERQQCAEYFYKQMKKEAQSKESKSAKPVKPTQSKPKNSPKLPSWVPDFSKPYEVPKQYKSPFFDLLKYTSETEVPSYPMDKVNTEFDLPLTASVYRKGGRLIRKGLKGLDTLWILPQDVTYLPDGNVEIYLEPDLPPLPESRLREYREKVASLPITSLDLITNAGLDKIYPFDSELKEYEYRSEEPMDLTVQNFAPQITLPGFNVPNSTYIPTRQLKLMGTLGPYNPHWLEYLPGALVGGTMLAAVAAPIGAGTALAGLGKATVAVLSNPATLKSLLIDTGLYLGADIVTEKATGKTIGQHINKAVGLGKNDWWGETVGFLATGLVRQGLSGLFRSAMTKLSSREALSPAEEIIVSIDNNTQRAANNVGRTLTEEEQKQLVREGYERAVASIGSEEHILQIMNAGVSREKAEMIAQEMRNNITNFINPEDIILDPTLRSEGNYSLHLINGQLRPVVTINPNYDIIEEMMHEVGGHGRTFGVIGSKTAKDPEVLSILKKYFPHFEEVLEHNMSLTPTMLPYYKELLSRLPRNAKEKEILDYVHSLHQYFIGDEVTTRATVANNGYPLELDKLNWLYTKESLDKLRKGVWGILPILSPYLMQNQESNANRTTR